MDRKLFVRRLKSNKYSTKCSKEKIQKTCAKLVKFHDPVLGVKGGYYLAKTEEELSELGEAISHVLFHKGDGKLAVLEEMADVIICMELTRQICGIKESELNKAINIKLTRSEDRMVKWKKENEAKKKKEKKEIQKKKSIKKKPDKKPEKKKVKEDTKKEKTLKETPIAEQPIYEVKEPKKKIIVTRKNFVGVLRVESA